MSKKRDSKKRDEGPARFIFFLAAFLSIFAVFIIVLFIFRESLQSITELGLRGLFSTEWSPNVTNPPAGEYGMLNFLWGTIFSTACALVVGAPLAIGAAVFIDQIASPKVSAIMNRGIELLAGIPSVVLGWFGLTTLVPFLAKATGTSGYGVFAATLVLTVMVLPTITALSADALRSLPPELEEASLAVGATRWQTISRTLIPAAKRGILIAVILGMGRAIGETMAVQMVIGNSKQFTTSLFQPTSTLTTRMITDMGEAPPGVFRSALYAQGLVLLLFAMMLIIAIRFVSRERN